MFLDFTLPQVWAGFVFTLDLIIRIGAIFIVPRNRRPTSGMAWLLAIFFMPFIGTILFLIIGSRRLPKSRRRKQEEVDRLIAEVSAQAETAVDVSLTSHNSALFNVVSLSKNLGALSLVGHNSAKLYRVYEESIAEMAAAVREANDYVHVQFYIFSFDKTTKDFFAAMQEAVARGVKVRVLLDYVASVRTVGNKKTIREFDRIGVQWSYMLPVRPLRGEYQRPDLRNHRKLLVIDGRVGFMGSQNMIDDSYNKKSNIRRGLHWRDLMTKLEGPVVYGLNAVFLSDWFAETNELITGWVHEAPARPSDGKLECQIVPSGPGFVGENNLQMFVSLLYSAHHRISITSPYFVPDESILYALVAATARGVDVELFVSEIGDQAMVFRAQRSYYEEILRAGVRIFMYRPPYILHSKHFSIDDDIAVIGSSNMDQRSFSLNMEVSMMVHGESFVRDLDDVTDYYREHSRELTLEEWMQQPMRSTLLDNLARLTSALQ